MKTSSPATPMAASRSATAANSDCLASWLRPRLGEDLDHHDIRRPLEAEAGILGQDLPRGMFGQDVEVVPLRNAVFGHDGVMDAPTERLELLRGPALVDVDSHEWQWKLLQ